MARGRLARRSQHAVGGEEAAQPGRVASHRSGLLAGCCGPCGTRRPSSRARLGRGGEKEREGGGKIEGEGKGRTGEKEREQRRKGEDEWEGGGKREGEEKGRKRGTKNKAKAKAD